MSDLVRRVRDIAKLDRPHDQLVAVLADLQHGVVARWQLLALGLSSDQVHDRVVRGHLHRVYRGVYSVGRRRLSREGRWMAAVLACGQQAVLSHRSAIALWGLRPPVDGAIDVTDPLRSRVGHRGVRVHGTRRLEPADRTAVNDIPVTSVHRTLLDYAGVVRPQELRLAIEMADRKELYDGRAMDGLLARSRGRKGAKKLRAVLAVMRGAATPETRSELERAFLALIRGAGLPEPQANVLVAGHLVDFVWPNERVVVEVDGYEWHKTRHDFEQNRVRDTQLQLAGYRVMRPTHPRIAHQPQQVVSELARMLDVGRSGR